MLTNAFDRDVADTSTCLQTHVVTVGSGFSHSSVLKEEKGFGHFKRGLYYSQGVKGTKFQNTISCPL